MVTMRSYPYDNLIYIYINILYIYNIYIYRSFLESLPIFSQKKHIFQLPTLTCNNVSMVVEMVPLKGGIGGSPSIPQLAGKIPRLYTTYSPCQTWGVKNAISGI